MSSNDDHIYQFPEASLAKRKDTGMYISRDEWWAMNRLGRIKGVDYLFTPPISAFPNIPISIK